MCVRVRACVDARVRRRVRLRVRVWPYLPNIQSACAVFYCHLRRPSVHPIFPRYLANGRIFGEKFLNINSVF
jgi:hypothetical protein